MTVLIALGDVPWPSTSGGRLRDAVTVASVDLVKPDAHLVCFAIRGTGTGGYPRQAEILDIPFPRRPVSRIVLRTLAALHRRHPFQEHLLRAGAIERFDAIVRAVRPRVTILGYPLYVGFADVAKRSGSRVFVDLMERRTSDARGRMRTGADLRSRARGLLDAWSAGSVEQNVAATADEVWFVALDDAIRYARATRAMTRVVPNTVRVDAYEQYRSATVDRSLVGFVGSFDNAANRAAALRLVERVLPLLRPAVPDIRIRLIGRRPPLDFAAAMAKRPGVELVADAPDAIGALAETVGLVAPLESGSGTKLKILEAAAAGIPIVTNTIGLAGLTLRPGTDALVADDDAGFADAIVRLRAETGLRQRLRDSALETVTAQYDVAIAHRIIAEAIEGAELDG